MSEAWPWDLRWGRSPLTVHDHPARCTRVCMGLAPLRPLSPRRGRHNYQPRGVSPGNINRDAPLLSPKGAEQLIPAAISILLQQRNQLVLLSRCVPWGRSPLTFEHAHRLVRKTDAARDWLGFSRLAKPVICTERRPRKSVPVPLSSSPARPNDSFTVRSGQSANCLQALRRSCRIKSLQHI